MWRSRTHILLLDYCQTADNAALQEQHAESNKEIQELPVSHVALTENILVVEQGGSDGCCPLYPR